MRPIRYMVPCVVVALVVTSCAGPASREEHAPKSQGAAAAEPAPLTGAAREAMRRVVETHDDQGRIDFRTPGFVTTATGERLAYDRYLVVGSTLTADRGDAFRAFVAELERDRASFVTVERSHGAPTKILVDYDGLRYVVAVGQW